MYRDSLAAALWVAAALLHPAASAQPPGGCPAGTRFVRESTTAWHCLPVRLPTTSPGFFVTGAEVQFARQQLAELAIRKRRYQDQLAALDRMRSSVDVAAKDLNHVRQEIVMDNMGHALNVISWAAGDLVKGPARDRLLTELSVLKGTVNAASAVHAQPESDRRHEKAIDAAFNFKNLVVDVSGAMSPATAEAFKHASDALPKMLKVSQRFAQPNPDKSTWELAAATADDVVAAVGEFVGALKATRSTVHIVGGEVAMWHIRQSKDAIDEAFVHSQTAKRYYLQKIAENEQSQEFYRDRIRRSEIK